MSCWAKLSTAQGQKQPFTWCSGVWGGCRAPESFLWKSGSALMYIRTLPQPSPQKNPLCWRPLCNFAPSQFRCVKKQSRIIPSENFMVFPMSFCCQLTSVSMTEVHLWIRGPLPMCLESSPKWLCDRAVWLSLRPFCCFPAASQVCVPGAYASCFPVRL